MAKIISFDMDGTLIDPSFTDWVWMHGLPKLYAEKIHIPFEKAKAYVIEEYQKVGDGAVEWYDIKYWLRFFRIDQDWESLLRSYIDKIRVYDDVNHLLDRLKDQYGLILTSNAGKEFIEIEMEATGLRRYFSRLFSATSDYQMVKKTVHFYEQVCQVLNMNPHEMIHVGDHFEYDYLVPLSIGIRAFYLDRRGEEKGEFVLHSLKELETRI
ncbi:MAG: HAD family hydrolase [Thermodesulfobacteriota bacterium]